ncbi:hypothetical protein BMR1_02g03100 [Babesia microti strain RI]|uniref:Uncharacterized protein n=1 Tax=Babesia microti (strain RI) TaxID=1133968 RepID=I7I8W0_BABMR|nr:hypothetical protein BMR1_02g03100 [Babesia microti strain RI]CCF73773.1 hypothetical protein BMR1_02g03100 [Babesia microti strain RI]|eukprot:XP_012648382.1 hypothetical protein BMR1_02g03100 [Babesia microti strain RI]
MDEYDNFIRGSLVDSSASSHIRQSQPLDASINAGNANNFPSFQYPFTQFQMLTNDEADKSTRCSDILTEIDGSGSNSLKPENLALWKELKKLKRELVMLHLGLSQHAYGQYRGAPIVINNNTEALAHSQTYNQSPKEENSKFSTWMSKFFSRPANRIIFVLSLGLTGYMLQEKIKKSYILSMIEDKINRNPLLKTVYALEEFLGLRQAPKLSFF